MRDSYIKPGYKQGYLTVVKVLGIRVCGGRKRRLILLKCGCGNDIELIDKMLHGKHGQISCGCLCGYTPAQQQERMAETCKDTDMTELIPRLFISNWHQARASQRFYIVTVAADSEFIGDEHYKLVDGPGNDKEVFNAAVKAVCDAHRSGKQVLVHCIGGRSRSAAVIVAAATILTGKPLCELYDLLLYKHDGSSTGARIHPHLSKLLLEYE